ncbi:MAG: PAS domain-containing protein [Planctomycetota bacterium]
MAWSRQSIWRDYAIALAASATALFFSYFLLGSSTPFLPCVAVVMVLAWKLGPKQALLSGLLFVAVTSYGLFILYPKTTPFDIWRDIARELIFFALLILVNLIASSQRNAEAQVREQAEWLRFALAHIDNGIIGADEFGRITYINPMAQHLTGVGPEAIGQLSSDVFKIASLASKENLEDPITKVLRYKTPVRFDESVILIAKDGRRKIIDDCAAVMSSSPDTPLFVVLVFRDVTEQRRIEEETRISAERFHLALEVGKLVPWEWVLSSGELISSRMNSLLPGADVSMRDNFLTYVHPDDVAMIKHLTKTALEEHKNYVGRYRMIRLNGDIIWVESHGQPFYNDRGEPVKLVGVLRDVTEQELVEHIVRDGQEQFRNVAESAVDGFVTVDERGKILYANTSFATLFGYPRAELIGMYLTALVPGHLRERHENGMRRYSETGLKTVDWKHIEFPGLRKDGSEFALEMSYSETRAGARRLLSAIVRDVSQRKKDAEAMRAARDRLELAQTIAGIGTFEWDFRTGHSTISPELEAMFGFKPGDFDGSYDTWEKLVHPSDILMVRENTRILMTEDRPVYSATYRIVWPDKSVHWMSSKTKVFRDDNGVPLSALGVNLDITPQKEAEVEREKLLTSERETRMRLELAQRSAEIGTFEWDARTGETHFSPELEALYGFNRGEFQQTYEHWTRMVHPDDWPRVAENSRATLESSSNDYAVEYRVIWPDKSVHWITTKGKFTRNENGKPLRLIGVEQDITAQKESAAERERLLANEKQIRERFELAQRTAGIGIHERTLSTDVIQCSPEFRKLIGLPSDRVSFTFNDWLTRVHPDDQCVLLKGIEDAITSTEEYSFEYRVVHSGGVCRWLATHGKIVVGENGIPTSSIGATIDITDRKMIDAQREHMLEREKSARSEAERATQLKDEFLATVSHELRTPLTAIVGWAQLLTEAPAEPTTLRRGLDSILRNGRAQAKLVEDLLDVSRIVTGQIRVQMQMLDLAEVVAVSVDAVRPTALAKKVELKLLLHPARIMGDPDRLYQVAFNILFNAVKFSIIGGLIEVSVSIIENHVHLIIKDNGNGIDPAFLPSMFQRFTQEDSSSTRRHGGMGLGLAIARHLVELHGGTIHAASEGLGKGATMTVILPILARGDSQILNRPTTASSSKDGAPNSLV